MARLFALPVIPVVFDGPERPSFKRGKKVVTQDHFLTVGTQALDEAFRFATHQAPGEAEAKLALMNSQWIIDAVLTDDSDTLVFGAHTIIRNGGDYAKAGLSGCGTVVASKLAQYGLGDALLARAQLDVDDPTALAEYLVGWRKSLRTYLKTDPCRYLGRVYPSLAAQVTDTFPDVDIINAYVHPVTLPLPFENIYSFKLARPHPDYVRLAQLCEAYFTWGVLTVLTGIIAKFNKWIWEGVFLRELISDILHGSPWDESGAAIKDNYEMMNRAATTINGTQVPARWFAFRVTPYVTCLLKGLLHPAHRKNDSNDVEQQVILKINIPTAILSHANPTVLNSTITRDSDTSTAPATEATASAAAPVEELTGRELHARSLPFGWSVMPPTALPPMVRAETMLRRSVISKSRFSLNSDVTV
ncbi:hypothetical protein EUX98_g8336 [Antrodiella citrinella]|uniref:XPG-I domain-containing protein n=1 Tax=Antrodiella citrinella TaxID=2447956 RepID=A0A4S4M9Z2_9APHY|nr:hypothetical protein EUX98_g8336 [Antrodiella citrinella]